MTVRDRKGLAMRRLHLALVLLATLLVSGCGKGEYTLNIVNRTSEPITATGGREPVTVAPNGQSRLYVSKVEGTTVTVKSGDKELDKLVAGSSFPVPDSQQEVLYYAGDRNRLVLTDLGEFFVVDSKADRAMANKDPKVKVVTKMESGPTALVKRQLFLCQDGKIVTSLPSGSHPYRMVKVPEDVAEDQVEAYLNSELKLAMTASQK